MARADDTYYEFFDLTTQAARAVINGWELDLTAGSGTATATFLVSNRGAVVANALDRTSDIWGASSYTADEVFVDNGFKLSGIKYVWWKIVLSTGGANDGDYAIHWVTKQG
ncbi:MAG: hypothetical protein ACYTEQ_23915 [Planctomycetota bacterium]|jgi:hypothetical protein